MVISKKQRYNYLPALILLVLSPFNAQAENIHQVARTANTADMVFAGQAVTPPPISDATLSHLRGQGYQLQQPEISVLLWDEVDKPQHQPGYSDAPTTHNTISVEVIKP